MKRTLFLQLFLIITFSLSAEIRIGIFDGAKPVSYIDENGNPAGIYPLVLEEIFLREGVDFSFVSGLSFHEAYDMVLSGDLDLMVAFIKTAERQELFDFSNEVFQVSWSQLFIHPDNTVENILDLKNQKIALMEGGQNGNNFLKLMDSFDIPFQTVYYSSFPKMTEAVLQGDVMGMVSFSSYALSENRIKATSIIFSPVQSYVAVRKDGPTSILQMIDDALIEMKKDDNSIYHIEMRKLSGTETVEVLPFWVLIIIITLTSGGLIVLLFFFLLRRKSQKIQGRLDASEDGYTRLFNAAPDLISVISLSGDNEWSFVDVNKAFCEKTGFTRDEMLSLNVEDYMLNDFRSRVTSIQMNLNPNDPFLLEAELPVKDGQAIPVQFSAQIFERYGEQYLLLIARDISEKYEFNSAVSAIQQKYVTIADYNYDWECWFSEGGEVIYMSPSCERISGYVPAEFMENKNLLADIVHPDDKGIWEQHCCTTGTCENDEKEIEFRLIRKDGTVVWINHECRRVYGPENQDLGIRGNFRDVTESKAMEEKLAQQQNLSSLGVLAGGIAHDFNNILAIIKGFSDVGRNKEGLDDEITALFEMINQASVRGESLTDQIMDFSRNKAIETKPVQVSAIVGEVYKLIKPIFPSSIDIHMNIENKSFIMADAGQVHRAIMNLCTNARLAMPDGGTLTLSVKELHGESSSRKPSDFSSSRCMEVMIRDSGVGMTKDVERRAFDPYFTTRKTGEGSGMGLAVVHGLVQQWGGQIMVESSPGKGTAFYLYLPILDYPIEVVEEEPFTEVKGNSSRILLIDDEPMILKLLEFYLDRAGYSYSSFSNASEALEDFRKNPAIYKLALMDMTMPGIQGDKLAELLRDIKADLPVILCSGSSLELQDKLDSHVIDRVLSKPFTQNDVLELIAELL